jgi:Fe-S cluster assembly protein SufD
MTAGLRKALPAEESRTEPPAGSMERFQRLGLPTARDESWRYTDLRSLDTGRFAAALGAPAAPLSAHSWLDPQGLLPTILVVNGHLLAGPGLQWLPPTIESFKISRLKDLSHKESEDIERRFPAFSDAERHRFALLNAALSPDTLHVQVRGAAAAPLLIVHLTVGGHPEAAAHPRVLIEAAPGARATIIEHHVAESVGAPDGPAKSGAPAAAVLCNSVTRIALAAGASIDHYRLFSTAPDATHFDTLDVRQAGDSCCRQFTAALGGGLVRTTLEARLEAAGASLDSRALLVGHESRHVDCVALAVHAAPRTLSRQTARAIASGESRVIFNSTARVEAGARGAESLQSFRGLLMSPRAEIDSRPQLEIHNDEVKCAHGATTGRLDPDMLFYLLSRGLDPATAQSLLVYAFLADVLTAVPLPEARRAIENALISQLPDSQLLRNFR